MQADTVEGYIRYLAAKKTVDDRALNGFVWRRLKDSLPRGSSRRPIRVIELGGGIGTMLERVLEWRLTPYLDYTFTERNADFANAFRTRLDDWSRKRNFRLQWPAEGSAYLEYPEGACKVTVITEDLYNIIGRQGDAEPWDVLIAHAVLDLVDLDVVLPGCRTLVKPDGVLYLSLNYDGATEFLPHWDNDFEAEVLERYHCRMELRRIDGRPAGARRTGRRLFTLLRTLQLPILAAGGSDWIVYGSQGGYAGEEAYFLDAIIATIWREVCRDPHLDPQRLAAWVKQRRAQIRSGSLIYMARNLDFLAGGQREGLPEAV